MEALLSASTFLNGAVALAAGFYVFLKNRRSSANRTFAAFAFFLGLWALGSFAAENFELAALASFSNCGALFLTVAQLHFVYAITGSRQKLLIILGYAFNLLILAAPLWQPQLPFLELAMVYKVWLAVWLGYLGYSLYLLFGAWWEEAGAKKYQLKFILFEYLAAFTFAAIAFFIFYDSAVSLPANVFSSPHLLSSAHVLLVFYLFLEYGFLKIKLLFPKFLQRLLSFAAALLGGYFFNSLAATALQLEALPASVLASALAVLVYNLTARSLSSLDLFKATNLESFRRVATSFKNQNVFYESVEQLQTDVQKNFCDQLGIESAHIEVLDLEGDTSRFPQLEEYFSKHNGFLVTTEEEFLAQHNHVPIPYLDELKSLGDVCYPLYQNTDELIGFFALKKNVSNDIYIEEELKLLEGVVHYVALSLMGIVYTEKLRQQTRQLQDSYNKLKKLDEAKDSFISVTSHELRTPSTVIKGYADMLLSNGFGPLTPQQKDFLDRIAGQVKVLLSIVNNIIDISKLEAGNMEFNFEKADVRGMIEKTVAEFKDPCTEKQIALNYKIEPEGTSFEVNTDPKRVKRILDGLVENACKFTPKDDKKANHIDIAVRKYEADPRFVQFSVQDTGPGIPKEAHQRIFEKFGQVEDFLQKTYTGTGLGLTIVTRILEKLGGKIWIESEMEKGSTFNFIIPLAHE